MTWLFVVLCRAGGERQRKETPKLAIALTTQVYADLWHRRLGRMNLRSMELLQKKDDIGVDFTGTPSDCDISYVHKSEQKTQHGKTVHETIGPHGVGLHRLHGPRQACSNGRLFVHQQFYRRVHGDEGDLPCSQPSSGLTIPSASTTKRWSYPLGSTPNAECASRRANRVHVLSPTGFAASRCGPPPRMSCHSRCLLPASTLVPRHVRRTDRPLLV